MAKAKKKRIPKKASKKTVGIDRGDVPIHPSRASTARASSITRPPPSILRLRDHSDRAEAAVEVLQAVFLHEKHFDLESEIAFEGRRPVVHQDADGHLWVTVKLHVPALDVDTWLDGTHRDHPDNDEADA